jgi:hypothetical protein
MGAEYWVQQRVASCPYEQPSLLNDVTGSSKDNPQENSQERSQQHSREYSQESKNAEKVHGLEFHFDKDEDAAEKLDEWIHPKYSTATYLDAQISGYPAGGAPLIVFQTSSEEYEGGEEGGDEGEEEVEVEEEEEEEEEDDDDAPELVNLEDSLQLDQENITRSGHQKAQKEHDKEVEEEEGEEDDEELNPTTPLSAWVIFPVVNRHVSFPGTFLHGVAGELLQPSLLLESHQNNDNVSCYSNGSNNSNENSNKYNNNSSNNIGNTGSENTRKRKIFEKKSIKLDGNSDKINLTRKCYNYSRLSLLVNVWTAHHPKAVERLDLPSFHSQFEKEQQIEMEMRMKNKIIYENKSVKDEAVKTDGSQTLKFIFQGFIENLNKDDDKECLSFTPGNSNGKSKMKINENVDTESTGPRSISCNLKSKLRLKSKLLCMSKVNVEEGVDDGVIRMMGNGIEESNIRVCHVDVPLQSEGKDDGEKLENKDYYINDSDNDSNNNNNNDYSNHISTRLIEVEHKKAKNNKANTEDKVIATSKTHKTDQNNNSNPSAYSDISDIYFLREHRPGDTAPVPLKPLRKEFQNSSKIGLNCGKIIHVKYNYPEASALLFE